MRAAHSPEAGEAGETTAASVAAAAGPVPTRPWTIFSYDTSRFPFAPLLMRDVFKVPRLDLLHEYVKAKRRSLGLSDRLTNNDNLSMRKLLQDLPDDSLFYRLYHHFMRRVLTPLVGKSLSYSSHPKMRVHFPDTNSVSSFHYDIIVTKRIDQVNFWMPFTDVDGRATLWLESDYARGDYAPVPVRYGEVLIFDGGYLTHGSVPNRGPVTRVSLDMRFGYKGAHARSDSVDIMNRIIKRLEARAARPQAPTPGPADTRAPLHPSK